MFILRIGHERREEEIVGVATGGLGGWVGGWVGGWRRSRWCWRVGVGGWVGLCIWWIEREMGGWVGGWDVPLARRGACCP